MWARLISLWNGLFRRESVEQDLSEELRAHIQERADAIERGGADRQEALRRARLEFGTVENYKERCREARGLRWPDELRQDLRYAARMARKNPGFTAVAVLSLALGIGANTAIFSILNSLLLTSLPVRDPQRLVILERWGAQGPGGASYPVYLRMRSSLTSVFEDLCAVVRPEATNVSLPGEEPRIALRESVTANYFDVLGLRLIAGSTFPRGEERANSPLVAVISERFWKSRMNADPSVVGKTLLIDNAPATIAGVLGGEFAGIEVGNEVDLWTNVTALDVARLSQRWNFLHFVGRLKPGETLARAQAAAAVAFQMYQREMMSANQGNKRRMATMISEDRMVASNGATGVSQLRRRFATPLRIVMGIVALVLLIACANITNLLLARTAKRQREIATRLSMGAGSGRLFRQFLTESLLLAICGAIPGLALAAWTARHLLDLIPSDGMPLSLHVELSLPVLLFTSAVAIGAGLLFGIVPALRVSRSPLITALKFTAASDFGGARGAIRPGRVLSAAQIALSTLLIFGAGLFVRTLQNLKSVDAGFRGEQLVTFDLTAPRSYSDQQKDDARQRVLDRMKALPGVSEASVSWPGPFDDGRFSGDFKIPGVDIPQDGKHDVDLMLVSPSFFHVMGAVFRGGRDFGAIDARKNSPVAIVNEKFAATYFAGRNPVGMIVQVFPSNPQPANAEIVGVVHDIRHYGLRESAGPAVYIPITEMEPPWSPTIAIKLQRDLSSASRDIQRAVTQVDPRLGIDKLQTMDQRIDAYLEREHLLATIAGLFSTIALLLAAVGLYGVMSYAVARRTKEFGLRMALGAQRRRVLDMILLDGIGVAAVGVAIGVPAAFALTRLVSAFLFDVKPSDAGSLAIPIAVMLATAFIAVLFPAWRATRVDPMVALRDE